jgi:flavoprotein
MKIIINLKFKNMEDRIEKTEITIHDSKNSDGVKMFLDADKLSDYCSIKYAKKIIKANEDGNLYGAYFTRTGRIRATFN